MKLTKQDEKNQRKLTQEELTVLQHLIDSGKLAVEEEDTNGLEEFYDEKEVETIKPITNAQLKKLRVELKDIFLKDKQKVLEKLKGIVVTDSEKYDDVLLLINRLKRFKNQSAKGVIPYEASEVEFRTISNAILVAVNTLEPDQLKSNK